MNKSQLINEAKRLQQLAGIYEYKVKIPPVPKYEVGEEFDEGLSGTGKATITGRFDSLTDALERVKEQMDMFPDKPFRIVIKGTNNLVEPWTIEEISSSPEIIEENDSAIWYLIDEPGLRYLVSQSVFQYVNGKMYLDEYKVVTGDSTDSKILAYVLSKFPENYEQQFEPSNENIGNW
jgi:hypothetical protein